MWLVTRVLLMVAVVLLACCEPPCGPSSAVVAKVLDGDTIVLDSGERVRYLLVDTPETSSRNLECYGPEARELNRSLVEGRTVSLSYGEACMDRYDRLLAYVSVDGLDVNTYLVERGYACVLYIPPAGEARRTSYQALEAEARRARRGLWGYCSPNPCQR
jgi:micrococcal nuclease